MLAVPDLSSDAIEADCLQVWGHAGSVDDSALLASMHSLLVVAVPSSFVALTLSLILRLNVLLMAFRKI